MALILGLQTVIRNIVIIAIIKTKLASKNRVPAWTEEYINKRLEPPENHFTSGTQQTRFDEEFRESTSQRRT